MRVLWLVPSKKGNTLDMLFAKRGKEYLEKNGFHIFIRNFYVSKSIFGMFQEILEIRNFMKENKISLIHAQFGSTTALTALLTLKPFVITFRGTDINGDPASSKVANSARYWMSIIAAHFSKGIITVSNELRVKLHFVQSKTIVIPSGTKVELFSPIHQSLVRKELNLDLKKKYIGFASSGRRPLKRFDIAEKVRDSLREKGVDIDILEIWQIPHDKICVYINSSDVVILTSEREGSPNIIREAIACGVPVVSFDVGDVRKWLKLDRASTVIPDRDIDQMSIAVYQTIQNPPKHERRVDVELFSEENSAKKVLIFYKSIQGTLLA